MTLDIEDRLRATLEARANGVTPGSLSTEMPTQGAARPPVAGRRLFAVAASLLAVTAIATGLVASRNREQPRRTPPASNQSSGSATADPSGRAWPLTDDGPLAQSAEAPRLQTPDSAARAYVTDVIGLPADWPLDPAVAQAERATVHYVLQDVAATIDLVNDPSGLWFVHGATTELANPGQPVDVLGGMDVSVGPGPRTYDDGVAVRVRAVAADGRVLDETDARVPPASRGAGAAGPIVSLRWAGHDLAAVVRADALSDHDGDPATPDVVVGHWTAAVDAPALTGLPASVDLSSVPAVFTGGRDVDATVVAYVRDRFPDYPEPGITIGSALTRGPRAWATWSTLDGGAGRIALRRDGARWDVVAATTDDVALTDLRLVDGRIMGSVASRNVNAVYADVVDGRGEPVPGSPRPNGYPGATYRFGTAGGPGEGGLDLNVAVASGGAIVRVRLVGGTMLSVSEVWLQ